MTQAQAIVAAMITPALLILASASLIATVLVRLARIVDRVRKLADVEPARRIPGEIERHARRATLAQRALVCFFSAIVCVVCGGFAIGLDHAAGDALWWLPIAITSVGMLLIIAGCAAMIGETRLSVEQVDAEIALLR
jgi:hypothetical protein